MKVIYFSGLKGGTGKTTLAVHLCNYLHFYEKKTVCLLNFDKQRILSLLAKKNSAPYMVTEINVEDFSKTFLESLTQEYIIVDLPGLMSIEKAIQNQWELADAHVLPFLSSALDFYKLLAFFQLATKRKIWLKQTFLLPNRNSRQAGGIMLENIRKQPHFLSSVLLPSIISSSKLTNITFTIPNSTIMNYIRPSFITLIDKI